MCKSVVCLLTQFTLKANLVFAHKIFLLSLGLNVINPHPPRFEPIIPNTAVPSEHSWNTPQRLTIPGPPDSGAGDADRIVGVSYKLCTINDR